MMHPKKKNSIMSCMNGFIGAVNNMDQTVMVPNLLRDIPLDRHAEMSHFKSDLDEGDLYASYHLLKTLRGNIEWGVKAAEDKRLTRNNSLSSTSSSSSSSSSSEMDEEDDNIEKQFQYHLTGLQGVLSKLTVQANSLTSYYKQRVGI
ncbi:mid1-interacting protein 1-B-like [Hippocampus zosterae]|uniref:mid1-interacting protein 1-B-like n=1 Tax=Hippocampus zosterae TaxID=109293 RepID=UPI00223E2BA7|nr:mid1-interacting protein 1-B-like [Hippocampus zosterae]XP_051939062.1 mid1-interacting protein 1-B-like [Hippocampus zosterae]XP_051939063.1 mid1-interacting protein 1-B-like [Hippocampus zosterae]